MKEHSVIPRGKHHQFVLLLVAILSSFVSLIAAIVAMLALGPSYDLLGMYIYPFLWPPILIKLLQHGDSGTKWIGVSLGQILAFVGFMTVSQLAVSIISDKSGQSFPAFINSIFKSNVMDGYGGIAYFFMAPLIMTAAAVFVGSVMVVIHLKFQEQP